MSYEVTECFEKINDLFFPTIPKFTQLEFSAEAWAKIVCYINLIGDYEITGFGRVVDNKVIDIKILKQTVKQSTVDCDLDSMVKFLMEIPSDQRGQWILDWHSHVNMGVFASGTDTTNYKDQWEARLKEQYPYLIINKSLETYCQCYHSPSRSTNIKLSIEDLKSVSKDRLVEIYNQCKADIEALCEKYTYTRSTYTTSTYNWNKKKDEDEDDYDNYYNGGGYWQNGSYYSSYNYSQQKLPTTHHGGTCATKKNDIDASAKKNVELLDERDLAVATDEDYKDEFCCSCNTYLNSAIEYDRGLCDDCWEAMSEFERACWKEGYALTNK